MSNKFEELGLDSIITSQLDYNLPTDIQSKFIPEALNGRDVLASSPTGTGKTLAYILPVLQNLIDFPRKRKEAPKVLILCPTRELANQVHDILNIFLSKLNLKSINITGGVTYDTHANSLKEEIDIIVATPGRLKEYIDSNYIDCYSIELLVLDEADRMLHMGFKQIVLSICKKFDQRKQTLLLSATIESDEVIKFGDLILNNPIMIEGNPSRKERKKINQWYYRADTYEHKLKLLLNILNNDDTKKSIIFVKKKEGIAKLSSYLSENDTSFLILHADLKQSSRNKVITEFDCEKSTILISTDLSARGIDFKDISHVINFDLPYTGDTYVHRIGRTARAGKKGNAISLVEAHDQRLIEKFSRYTDELIKERFVEGLRPSHKKPKITKKKKKKKK
ncbi:ATP-dependent RNA helicase SrmB [Paraphotobacterium marinum]|uniref:ATP-dependent RNA helicase SrmB n=1 Tax=Paraphotobacterium marinum TaxID=1755811 RepID=UPI0039E84E1B